MSSKRKTLIKCIGIPLGGGMLIGWLTSRSGTYDAINKPPLSPPPIVFPIVWAILYVLMGIAWYLTETATVKDTEKSDARWLFLFQLLLNFMWPIIYFSLRAFWAASLCLAALIVVLILTIRRFTQIDVRAGRLLLPYLVWCLFAMYLNIGTAVLN